MAAHLGIWNVRAWLRSMSAAQFREWVAYYDIEPFGELRADWRAARVHQAVHNSMREKPEGDTKKFLLKFSSEAGTDTQSDEYKKSVLISIAHAWGASESQRTKDL